MSSYERDMDTTTLPGLAPEVIVDQPEHVGSTVLSDMTTNGKKRKGIGGFFRRAWKAVKHPFRRSCHETRVEVIVPDTSAPCASGLQQKADGERIVSQLSSVSGPYQPPATALTPKKDRDDDDDDLEVVSITSNVWSVCSNIQQDSALPADASAEDIESVSLKDNVENKQQEHVKEKKRKGVRGFFKRVWKAVKRPFRRSCHETRVKDKQQEQHVQKEKKKGKGLFRRGVNRLRWRSKAKLIDAKFFFRHHHRRLRENMQLRRCPHHRCCEHEHPCLLRGEQIVLGVREQIMSTVPSVSGPSMNYPEQVRHETFRKEKRPISHFCCKTKVKGKPQEQHGKKKKKGLCGFFQRIPKAVKHPFRRCQSRVEPIVSDTSVPCASGLQESLSSVSSSSGESFSHQYSEPRERTPLLVPPMFKPSDEEFQSRYRLKYVILGDERFGNVFLAIRKSDGQKVAVKEVSRPDWSTSTYNMAGYIDHVMTEVAMMTLLQQGPISPYVIQMLEWFHEEFDTYIVMEDPGPCTALRKLIELHPLDEKIARVLMRQAVQAAQHCIAHGVFHTNISAENILVNTTTLDLKLTDFGYSMPYTARKYYRFADDDVSTEYEHRAVASNVQQLGQLLRKMIFGPDLRRAIFFGNPASACGSLIEWCTQRDPTKRPTLEQMLQHRWFTQE